MTPLLDPAGQGAPEDWLRHAQSDLRVARLARYPGGFAEVRRQEVDQAIAVAEKVLDWARQQIIPSNTGST